jgi:hypothetical protein
MRYPQNHQADAPISSLMTMTKLTKHLAALLALGCIVFPNIATK